MRSQESFEERVDATHSQTIQGALLAGAIVRSGATLTVQGAVNGEVVIEPEAILMVQGVFSGTVRNEGTLLLAGVVHTDLGSLTGRVAVAAESLISVGAGVAILNRDGSLKLVEADVPALNTGREYLVLIDGAFAPLETDQS